jgi:hypothetical protein
LPSQGFKNFLRKLQGEQNAAPLTSLDDEHDAVDSQVLLGSGPENVQVIAAENGTIRQKEGCGGPGSMCCCPCGALKSGAHGESKIKMEKVLVKNIFKSRHECDDF